VKIQHDETLLDFIPFIPDIPPLHRRLRIKPGSAAEEEFADLLAQAQAVARPRALYRPAYIDERGSDDTWINGIKMTSRVLAVNLKEAGRVFPFIITCGAEVETWAGTITDPLAHFWADALMEAALFSAAQFLETHLVSTFQLGHTSVMNPGSLEDWPLTQQRQLFDLFAAPENTVGVRLTESFLMLPRKSVSGIRFPLEATFESCQLCPREVCPGRRAPYDAGLFTKQYGSG
jgi:hypothetical protein